MDDFIPTRGAKNKKNLEKLHEVTTYESHKKSSKPFKVFEKNNTSHLDEIDTVEDGDIDNQPVDEQRKQELEMKRYRYDVIKFGMSGFEKKTARQMKIALAISLGAKPPKNKRKNYKKLIEERKQEKSRKVKKEKFASGFNPNQLIKKKNDSKSSDKKDKESNGILIVYGKVTKDKGHKRKGQEKYKERG